MNEVVGRRFSLVYLRRPEMLRDDPRMRRRLSRVLHAACGVSSLRYEVNELISCELGVTGIGYNQDYSYKWDEFFDNRPIDVVLDMVTLVRSVLISNMQQTSWENARDNVIRVFAETQVGYTVDPLGGVRFLADEAYEANVTSAISSLQSERYKSAASYIAEVERSMTQTPPDSRSAIRSVFDASENIFKQMSGRSRLTRAYLDQDAPAWIRQAYANDDHARLSVTKTLTSFGAWIDGAHFYRHEAGRPEPSQPPEDLAILVVSQGIAFVRWLSTLDAALQAASSQN